MQLRDVTATLQLETHQEVLSREWEVSQRSRPTGDLSFLRRDYLADICQTIGIPLRRSSLLRVPPRAWR